ncbi:MAG: PaaI family thioesterase [Xanthomonadaceae bacterium]|nr:PaaI family thioesterase [Xanthomonadaceae bacterium]
MHEKNLENYIQWFKNTDKLGEIFSPKIVSLSETECLYEYTVIPAHFNPSGILHGGALYTVMDSSQGLFVHYILDDSFKAAATGTATIKYLAPLKSGVVKIRTYLKEKSGRKLFVNSVATDESGREVATLEEIWIAILK